MSDERAEPTDAELDAANDIVFHETDHKTCKKIAQALANARVARDKEWAEAFHRGDWFEDEPDMTLEAFRAHGMSQRKFFDEVAKVSHAAGVDDGLEKAAERLHELAMTWHEPALSAAIERIRALKGKL